jgi:hypothetical protein
VMVVVRIVGGISENSSIRSSRIIRSIRSISRIIWSINDMEYQCKKYHLSPSQDQVSVIKGGSRKRVNVSKMKIYSTVVKGLKMFNYKRPTKFGHFSWSF